MAVLPDEMWKIINQRRFQTKTPESSSAVLQHAGQVDYGAGLTGMRKTIAERMMNSLQASAQVFGLEAPLVYNFPHLVG